MAPTAASKGRTTTASKKGACFETCLISSLYIVHQVRGYENSCLSSM